MKTFISLLALLTIVPAFGQELPEPPPAPPREPEIFSYTEAEPEFPGGYDSLKAFIARNLVYPETAIEQGLEGKAYLQFVVSEHGTISNVTVARGVPGCPECDKEAIRVIKKMPKWKPGQNKGKNVNTRYTLPVNFSLYGRPAMPASPPSDVQPQDEQETPVEAPKQAEPVKEPAQPEIFTYLEAEPEFPGGRDSLKAFIARNLLYPATAVEQELQGKVYLRFVVSSQGNISNVSVVRGIPDCPECDKEAIRVIKKMPKWKPGQNSGKNVNCSYNLPVKFDLSADYQVAPATPPSDVKTQPEPEMPVKAPKQVEPVKEPAQPEIYKYVEETAQFPGGPDSLKAFIQKNLRYPASAKESAISGKCYLQFIVSASGNISNIVVQRGIPGCEDCDKEAIRLIKSMPKWAPGKNRGQAVHSVVNLPVSFVIQ